MPKVLRSLRGARHFTSASAVLLMLTAASIGARAAGTDPSFPSLAMPAVGEHAVWVTDRAFSHSQLFDGDSGRMLGMVDVGGSIGAKAPLHARSRGEIYAIEHAYARGLRGKRTDFVTIYDAASLDFVAEVILPIRTADTGSGLVIAALLDEGRFLGVFGQFPNSSVSIIDLERRAAVSSVPVAGCFGVYPVSVQRFATLCGDGTVLMTELDGKGQVLRSARSDSFFDSVEDPVFVTAARRKTEWVFTSFSGEVHIVDFTGERPAIAETWSLLDDDDREMGWRPGGAQHMALHAALGRLYVVMHRGGSGSHKAAGSEIWVYDLSERRRVLRIGAPNLLPAFIRPQAGIEEGGIADWLLGIVLPNQGVHSIAVTQDDEPLLFARHSDLGAVAVIDAVSGQWLRDLVEAGLSGVSLEVH